MNRMLPTSIAIFIAVLLLAALMVPAAETAPEAQQSAAPNPPMRSAIQEIVIVRDAAGKFHLPGRVNNGDVDFLVDTGATVVALTLDDARKLGIDVDPATFKPIGRTANGVGYGASITLDRLEAAGQVFRNVDAVVVDGLPVNLLGQPILGRLGRLEMTGDRMVIRP